jgi:D-amino peptidase
MKIFISTDMEGVAGVVSWNEMEPPAGKEWTGMQDTELNWLVDALNQTEFGKEISEIVVCDSHARGENVRYGAVSDKRVQWIRGYPRPFYMMEGLDQSFDIVFFLGYHASIGSWRGGMDHTYSSLSIYNIRLNGEAVGETIINAYYAGWYGVPIGLVSGDDVLERQIEDTLGVPFVRTKEGIGRFSAKVYHPQIVRENYQKAVQELLKRNGTFKPLRPGNETVLEVDLANTIITDAVSIIPGLERTGGRTVRYASRHYPDILRMILTIAMVGGRFADYR